jgi:hypothetical protein
MRLPTLPWFLETMREHKSFHLIGCDIEFGRPQLDSEVVTETHLWMDVQRGDAVDSFSSPAFNSMRRTLPGSTYPYHRAIGGEVLIHAVSPAPGARRQEHLEYCDAMLNALVWCAYESAREARCLFAPLTGGAVLAPGETPDLQQGWTENGARYLLRFTLAVPIVAPQPSRVTIGAAPNVAIASQHVVPFNNQDWPAQ